MLLPILASLAAVLAVFLVIVAVQPAAYRVARSTTIRAAPSAVFAKVNDLHEWAAWSPWAKVDPAMKTTYDGPPTGTGAGYAWVGNAKVGQGRMTITDSRPDERVDLRLDFLKPFTGVGLAEFTFVPQAGQTLVTWTMSGRKNFITKGIGLFITMDKMIGGQFARGLSEMKSICEATPATPPVA